MARFVVLLLDEKNLEMQQSGQKTVGKAVATFVTGEIRGFKARAFSVTLYH